MVEKSDLKTGQMRYQVWCPDQGVEQGDAKTIVAYSPASAGAEYQEHTDVYQTQFTAYQEVQVTDGENTCVVAVEGELVRSYSGKVLGKNKSGAKG